MKTKYKTFDLGTLSGLKQAEKYQAKGWQVHMFGFNILVMKNK